MKKLTNILLIFLTLSCSSTTIIKSTDSKARISVNGEKSGIGALIHTDKKVAFFGKNRVIISKDGCADQEYIFKRNEKLDIRALIFGVLIVPLIWVMQYKAVHEYEFICIKKAA